MSSRPLVALGLGLGMALLVAAALVPFRAWASAIAPVLVTVVLGGVAMTLVARRRPPEGEQPDHDPFGLLSGRDDDAGGAA
jgi:hypothetical protein